MTIKSFLNLNWNKYKDFQLNYTFICNDLLEILNDPILYRTITHNIGTLIIEFYTKYNLIIIVIYYQFLKKIILM